MPSQVRSGGVGLLMLFTAGLRLAAEMWGAAVAGRQMTAGFSGPASAWLRAVEAEGGDCGVEGFAGDGGDHVVGADHEAGGGLERGAGGVFEALAGLEEGLLADDAVALDDLEASAGVGDAPGAAEELHGFGAVVLDADLVGPDPRLAWGSDWSSR